MSPIILPWWGNQADIERNIDKPDQKKQHKVNDDISVHSSYGGPPKTANKSTMYFIRWLSVSYKRTFFYSVNVDLEITVNLSRKKKYWSTGLVNHDNNVRNKNCYEKENDLFILILGPIKYYTILMAWSLSWFWFYNAPCTVLILWKITQSKQMPTNLEVWIDVKEKHRSRRENVKYFGMHWL